MNNKDEQFTVYFGQCPEHGPEHRFYSEEDFQRPGGILAVEEVIEAETYWFVRLGTITGEQSSPEGLLSGPFISSIHDIARRPEHPANDYRAGRRNPAFGRSELELQIFDSIFHTVKTCLDGWRSEMDECNWQGYVVKELMITSDRISELASTLAGNGTVTEPIQLTAMKYWFDPQWTDPLLTDDFILADLPLTGVVQLHWSATEKSISCDLVSLAIRRNIASR